MSRAPFMGPIYRFRDDHFGNPFWYMHVVHRHELNFVPHCTMRMTQWSVPISEQIPEKFDSLLAVISVDCSEVHGSNGRIRGAFIIIMSLFVLNTFNT